jgi:hypothetical protein
VVRQLLPSLVKVASEFAPEFLSVGSLRGFRGRDRRPHRSAACANFRLGAQSDGTPSRFSRQCNSWAKGLSLLL